MTKRQAKKLIELQRETNDHLRQLRGEMCNMRRDIANLQSVKRHAASVAGEVPSVIR